MRTRLLFILIAVAGLFTSQRSNATTPADTAALIIQDSLNARSLIISEVQLVRNVGRWSYAELYNTGETTLDMSRYVAFASQGWNAPWMLDPYEHATKRRLYGTLEPGDTYLMIQRFGDNSRDPYQNILYPDGYVNTEAALLADFEGVRTSTGLTLPEIKILDERLGIFYSNVIKEYKDSIYPDSVFIDRFGTDNTDLSENPDVQFTIAGVNADEPTKARVYVRKYSVEKGNTIDGAPVNTYPIIQWNQSRGTDISDSEWLPLPHSQLERHDKIFTTVDYHGPQPVFSLTSDIASIDVAGKMITIPHGVSRDSVFRKFETGVNHGWELKLGSDTGQFFLQPDDSLFFYTVGTTLETYKFGLTITGELTKSAQVAPLVYESSPGVYTRRYNISDGEAPLDTIGTLPYDTPVDTFYKYMVKEAGATWDIIPASGTKSPEIKNGDILKVTAADETTIKEYKLGVMGFFPNHNADLNLVYFPGSGLWENPETFMPTDTMLNFNSSAQFYSVDLPIGTTVSPAIVAQASDHRSVVVVNRAKNLSGTDEERTATIVVTAEDDTTVNEYKILFNVERETPPIKGSLFISDIARAWGGYNQSSNVFIYNPASEDVDLSEYAVVAFPNTNFDAVINAYANDSNWVNNNMYLFRFGSIVEPAEDGTPVFKADLNQRKLILESKSPYGISGNGGWPIINYLKDESLGELADKYIHMIMKGPKALTANKWPTEGYVNYYAPKYWNTLDPYQSGSLPLSGFKADMAKNIGIVRILNDSVKDGTKHVMNNFAGDYEWVDLFGGNTIDLPNAVLWDNDTIYNFQGLDAKTGVYRKPFVYKGNSEEGASFGSGIEETKKTINQSEWVLYGWKELVGTKNTDRDYYTMRDERFGNHVMITYAHISYLTSGVYIMEEGLEGPQQVYGVTSGTTVSQFLGNVNKADEGMDVKVYASNGDELTGDDPIEAGTNVWSWNATGLDSVNYVISNLSALSADCSISSSVYTVSADGATGTISGISMGTTLEDLIKDLTPAQHSVMVVTDGGEYLLPLVKYNRDTIAIQNEEMTPTLASTKAFVEVTAQDKVTKCIYALQFKEEADPFILSDVYVIDQLTKVINFAGRTTPNAFKAKLIPSTGASIKIVNKYDQERMDGTMQYSDRVIVSKGDKQVEYWVKYTVNEEIIGVDINNVETLGMQVYPNPTSDFVTLNNIGGKYVELRDLTGKLLSRKSIENDQAVIDMRKMRSGIYIISTEDGSFKVIKE